MPALSHLVPSIPDYGLCCNPHSLSFSRLRSMLPRRTLAIRISSESCGPPSSLEYPHRHHNLGPHFLVVSKNRGLGHLGHLRLVLLAIVLYSQYTFSGPRLQTVAALV